MTCIPYNTKTKTKTIQYKNKTIQSNTRQYSINIYGSVYYSQMAGTPQQLKPITVDPFNI